MAHVKQTVGQFAVQDHCAVTRHTNLVHVALPVMKLSVTLRAVYQEERPFMATRPVFNL